MNTTKREEVKSVVKLFLPWQDEKEETWLEEMASRGWMLESVVPFIYTFRKSTSEKTVYRLDYKNRLDKDYAEYLSIFNEAGWNLKTTLANWHYFSINPKNGVIPEIYNSNRAKSQKYRRFLLGLLPIFLLEISLLPHVFDLSEQSAKSVPDIAIDVSFLSVALLFIYSFLRVWIKLIQLNRNHQE